MESPKRKRLSDDDLFQFPDIILNITNNDDNNNDDDDSGDILVQKRKKKKLKMIEQLTVKIKNKKNELLILQNDLERVKCDLAEEEEEELLFRSKKQPRKQITGKKPFISDKPMRSPIVIRKILGDCEIQNQYNKEEEEEEEERRDEYVTSQYQPFGVGVTIQHWHKLPNSSRYAIGSSHDHSTTY